MTIRLSLPIPVSVNAAYTNVPGVGRVKTRAYKQWLKQADLHLMIQKRALRPVSGPLRITVWLPEEMRGDVSNRTKLPEDFLVSRKVTPDDKHNWSVTAERSINVQPGMCEIEIEEVRAA